MVFIYFLTVYADENNDLFLDQQLRKRWNCLLYSTALEPHTLFLDQQMTVWLEIHLLGG